MFTRVMGLLVGQCPDAKMSPVETSGGVRVKPLLLRKSLLETFCGVGVRRGEGGWERWKGLPI